MNKHFATRRAAYLLGFGGLIPFGAFSLGCWLVPEQWLSLMISCQLAYSVAILSFLGGIHWGAALLCSDLSIDRGKIALLWGVAPSLIAVLAAQLPAGPGFAVMIAAFLLVYLVDKRLYPWYRLPDWLPVLRFTLTCVVAAALAVTLAAVNFRS